MKKLAILLACAFSAAAMAGAPVPDSHGGGSGGGLNPTRAATAGFDAAAVPTGDRDHHHHEPNFHLSDVAAGNTPWIMIIVGIGNMDPHAVLRAALAACGLTTNQLANVMGMHRSTLSRYYHGEHPTPKHVALAALTVAMCSGVTVQFEKPFKQLTVAAKRARIT